MEMKTILLVTNGDHYPGFFRQSPGGKGIWQNIQITENQNDEYDVLVVLTAPEKPIEAKVKKEYCWLIMQEPPVRWFRWHRKAYSHFGRVYSFWKNDSCDNQYDGQPALPWLINKTYDELVSLTTNECKNKLNEVSWVTSSAKTHKGHKKRMRFKDQLLKKQFSFTLFGRGFNPIEDKFDGIFPYKYSVAIENTSCKNYWTEKISDCYLSWTMPIYFGCTNILDYFPEKSMILIDLNDINESINKMRHAIMNNSWDKNIDAIDEARKLILNEYQLFPKISKMVEDLAVSPQKNKDIYLIPANNCPKRYKYYKKKYYRRLAEKAKNKIIKYTAKRNAL